MIEQIELSSLDLRYEGYRLKSGSVEKALLAARAAKSTSSASPRASFPQVLSSEGLTMLCERVELSVTH